MIKNIFLPEKIKDYYLFQKRILGIDVNKTHINLSLVIAKGNTLTIVQHIEEPLEPGTPANYDERVVQALKNGLRRIKKFDAVRTIIPSSHVVFKQLKLPFVSRDKISMVIGFEVEPLLPFTAQDTVLDFIITAQDEAEQSSQVLVAATQKQVVAAHLDLLAQAGINPDVITIDLFALYDLFSCIPNYQTLSGSTALINMGVQATHIAYITTGKLTFIRTIPYGLSHIAKNISQTLNIPANQAIENIIRFGAQKEGTEQYTQVITQELNNFWQKIRFTLDSFAQQTMQPNELKQLVVLGDGALLNNLIDAAKNNISVPILIFDPSLISTHERIRLQVKEPIASTGIVSIAAALPLERTHYFNLRQGEFAPIDPVGTLKQLIVVSILTVGLLGGLIAYSIMQERMLSNELYESEQEVIDELKKRFKKIDRDEQDYTEAIAQASQELKKELDTLFKFSQRGRTSFLQSLFELTTRIDKEGLGFQIERLTITEKELTLKAQVRDHDALKVLERELRQSDLFSYVQPQDDPAFTMRITLARPAEGLS